MSIRPRLGPPWLLPLPRRLGWRWLCPPGLLLPWLLGRGRWSRSGRTGRCYVLGPPRPELRRDLPRRSAGAPEKATSRTGGRSRSIPFGCAPAGRGSSTPPVATGSQSSSMMMRSSIISASVMPSVPVPLSSCGAFGTSGGLAAEDPLGTSISTSPSPELTSSTTMAGVGRTHFGNGLILS